MNEVIGTKNCLIMSGVNKWLVSPFRRHELWKREGRSIRIKKEVV